MEQRLWEGKGTEEGLVRRLRQLSAERWRRPRAGRKWGGGEKWLEFGFVLKVELTALADGLEMHRERREGREVRGGSQVFCLSSWKDGVVISCEGADLGRSSCDEGSEIRSPVLELLI